MTGSRRTNKQGHITKGDIFDDLGLSPQEVIEAKVKSDLWRDLMKHIEERGYDRVYLKNALRIHQPDVSNLLHGKISRFKTGKLIQFAVRLDLDVHVEIKPKPLKRTVSNISAARAVKKHREPAHA